MSILDRTRAAGSGAAKSIGGVGSGLASGVGKGLTGPGSATGQLARGVKGLTDINGKNLAKSVGGSVAGTAAARATNAGLTAAQRFLRGDAGNRRATYNEKAEVLPRAQWTEVPWFGSLTLDSARTMFAESAMTQKAWKSLFHIRVDEQWPGPESSGSFQMMALDASFAPWTMPGEAVQIGGANMDRLAATDRVELRLATLDDARGTLKRWFDFKCAQAAHPDGTFGVPADYLVTITLTHMDTEGTAPDELRFRRRWLMRPANVDHELSRRAQELEELQMTFVQFDTFVQV